MVAARAPRATEPILDGALASSRPSLHRLDRMACVAEFLTQRSSDCCRVLPRRLGISRGEVHNCAPHRNKCALLSRHDALLCVYTDAQQEAVDRCTAHFGAAVAAATQVPAGGEKAVARGTNGAPSHGQPQLPAPVRAAQYVRMSTEHQQYSTENQADAIRQYADLRGFQIVRTYADEGRSGLSLDGRDAFKRLIGDVEKGQHDFTEILVYDVSRWGRFQDADEGGYYEHVCKRAGLTVHFCAEQFENDGSSLAGIVKAVKRSMAGEYSRELSVKVFAGQRRLIELGYRQGGPPGLGLRRSLVDQAGTTKGSLSRGEQKSIQTDRVVLVPGPAEEIEVIRWIYRAFVENRMSEKAIAEDLNARGILTDLNRPWTRGTVHQVLINEKYIGNNVWNRTSFKLKKRHVHNDPEHWIRVDGVFPAIVDPAVYRTAQEFIFNRARRVSNDDMLRDLQRLYQERGYLSGLIIDETDGLPSSSTYQSRFGSLLRAYQLVGYTPAHDYSYITTNKALRELHPKIVAATIQDIAKAGGTVGQDTRTGLITVNDEFTASIVIARCQHTSAGSLRWNILLDTGLQPDLTVAVRMNQQNLAPMDYYILPMLDMTAPRLRLAAHNPIFLDAYRFDTLDAFYCMAARSRLPEVA